MKKFIFLAVALVVFYILVVVDIYLNIGKQQENSNPTTAVNAVSKPTGQVNTQLDQETAVGNLLNILPYKGTNFSFSFNYQTNVFVLTLNKNNTAQGNTEFDAFLKKNNIADRSWFLNLTIVYQ